MLTRFKVIFLFRSFSVLLLSVIPSLFLFEILPPLILPVWSFIIFFLCFKAEEKKIKLSSAIFLIFFTGIIFWFIIFFICKIISLEIFDILYLRLGIIIPFLFLQTLFVSATTVLFLKKEKYRSFEPVLFFILFSSLFWTQENYSLSVFDRYIYAVIFSIVFLLSELTRLFLSFKFGKRQIKFFLFLLPALVFILFFIVKKYNENSVVNHGGLLQPTLFQFDFSDYLTLQGEIKMSGDLVLVAHFNGEFSHNMLRRLYLSGWDKSKGFYEKTAPDEKPQITVLPKTKKNLPHKKFLLRETAEQEYFFVNLSPSSFIAMDYPTSVIPYTIWDSKKFNGGYKVISEAVYSFAGDIYGEAPPLGNDEEGLSPNDLKFYTQIDEETFSLVNPKAKELTQDIPGYLDKILAIKNYFTDGDFRYSLKPGKAPDGNQLRYFLNETKKGYCTYYAFSFALMLRSLGIPSRVAVGFFVQPESEVLNYYPVRANMAHAWTEVFFPEIGWLSFDATTQQLASGENLNFSFNPGGDEFNSLLSEILENRNEIQYAEAEEKETEQTVSDYIKKFLKKHISFLWITIILIVLFLFLLYKIFPYAVLKFSKNNRRRVLTAGMIFNKKKKKNTSFKAIEKMNALVKKAKFAPLCSEQDVNDAVLILKNSKSE
ncbi:transglutaminase-like domain-containing protein [Treponema pedis]|uniref:transglutaminase-like domain-containing protein n=1 Tax=Treponema pedis TaxID=409322 RepID=UPI00209117B9|nr:transglutaminase-like domain-containing protein [Treponema pedis]